MDPQECNLSSGSAQQPCPCTDRDESASATNNRASPSESGFELWGIELLGKRSEPSSGPFERSDSRRLRFAHIADERFEHILQGDDAQRLYIGLITHDSHLAVAFLEES